MGLEAGGAQREMRPEGAEQMFPSWATIPMKGSQALDSDKIPLGCGGEVTVLG